MKKEFFTFSIPRTTIAGNSTQTISIRLSLEMFSVHYINGNATSGNNLYLEIKNINTNRIYMDRGVLFSSIVGTAQRPFILPEPIELEGNSNIDLILTDTSGSNNIVDLCLIGYKIFSL